MSDDVNAVSGGRGAGEPDWRSRPQHRASAAVATITRAPTPSSSRSVRRKRKARKRKSATSPAAAGAGRSVALLDWSRHFGSLAAQLEMSRERVRQSPIVGAVSIGGRCRADPIGHATSAPSVAPNRIRENGMRARYRRPTWARKRNWLFDSPRACRSARHRRLALLGELVAPAPLARARKPQRAG